MRLMKMKSKRKNSENPVRGRRYLGSFAGNGDVLSDSEQRVLNKFRQYLMTPNRMLCFSGPTLEQNMAALKSLTKKSLLAEATFHGGYSLTQAGFEVMKEGK